jgi:hypothetical protein
MANMSSTTTKNINILYDGKIRTIRLHLDQSSCLSPKSTKSNSDSLTSRVKSDTSPTPSLLLTLPAEIRHQIYKEVFSFNSTPRISLSILYNRPNLIGTLPYLPFLQTCRQIYDEARLVPFESNVFEFYRWYGSSSVECRKFLENLAPWQIEAIKDIRLGITECEIRGLGSRGASESFVKICGMLGNGLKSMTLDVDPQAVVWNNESKYCSEVPCGVWWVSKNATWITDGLVRLKALTSLHLMVFDQSAMIASDGGGDGKELCEHVLSEKLPWCGRVTICLQKNKGKDGKEWAVGPC